MSKNDFKNYDIQNSIKRIVYFVLTIVIAILLCFLFITFASTAFLSGARLQEDNHPVGYHDHRVDFSDSWWNMPEDDRKNLLLKIFEYLLSLKDDDERKKFIDDIGVCFECGSMSLPCYCTIDD